MTTLVQEANRTEETDGVMVILDQTGDTTGTPGTATTGDEVTAMREILRHHGREGLPGVVGEAVRATRTPRSPGLTLMLRRSSSHEHFVGG